MENETPTAPANQLLTINYDGMQQMHETVKWTKFIAITGFVMLAIMLAIPFVFLFVNFPDEFEAFSGFQFLPIIIVGAIYFFPIYYLFKFSILAKSALRFNDSNLITSAFKYLKLHYRFMGIMLIIVLAIYLIALIAIMTGFLIGGSIFT